MTSTAAHGNAIAITGMAFRFPGHAVSSAQYWALLNSGCSAIDDTPADRFDMARYYSSDPDTLGTTYSRRAGYIERPYDFDPEFFRISQAEALSMDPQQRWLLELCWSALENAGIAPSSIRGRSVGLYLTTGEVDYGRRTVWSQDLKKITTYARLGANHGVSAGRVAYFLGVHGPALFVDTACSSSLVAVHLAAQGLQAHDCDIAIAGGVNLILGPEETIGMARLKAMSTTETCRPFDAGADGYMRGEGGGVIVMRRLDDAERHGDRIDAVLSGSAINNDGPSNGLTAPNGSAQEQVIRRALQRAGIGPEQVSYVEAHGTGTPLGDPIELSALRNAYTQNVQRAHPLLVGSVKAQIGHLEVAAGIAGLIKAVLVLQHRTVPQQVNFERANPRFRWDASQIEVPRQRMTLPDDAPWIGVSGFGISGTNAHLVLTSHVPTLPSRSSALQPADTTGDIPVLTISARTAAGRSELADAYRAMLRDERTPVLDLCYTASLRRDHWAHRLAIPGATREALLRGLDDYAAMAATGSWHAAEAVNRRRLAFLFPGQGAWRPGIGSGLYREHAVFRLLVDRCLALLPGDTAGEVLRALLGEQEVRHRIGQLAHFVFHYALATMWIELGHGPDLVIGHSLGEHAAAVIAGVMSLEDGIRVVAARGHLFDTATPGGAMLAVAASREELSREFELGTDLFIAGVNGPEQTVLSGTVEAVADAHARMAALGKRVSRLNTYGTPGHSPLLRPMRDGFAAVLAEVPMRPPVIPLISTLTGRAADTDIAQPTHWLDLVEQPVLFAVALQEALSEPTLFLEVGPGAALSNLARQATQDWTCAIASLADGPEGDDEPEPTGLAHARARLYCAGRMGDMTAIYPTPPAPLAAPTYPFQRVHLEIPAQAPTAAGMAGADAFGELERAADEPPIARTTRATPAHGVVVTSSGDRVLEVVRQIAQSAAPASVVLDDHTALTALGFDSLSLTELRQRLQQTFGRSLAVSMLARGLSISGIAQWLGAVDKGNTSASTPAPDPSPLTVLREGRGEIVALVHPVGGDVLCYRSLAEVWPGDPTIVALRHPEIDADMPARVWSLDALARHYLEVLEERLGRLPDRLGGWSLGGLIALEMAAELERGGRLAPPLMLVDSPFHQGEFVAHVKAIVNNAAADAGPATDLASIEALERDARFRHVLDHDLGLAAFRDRTPPDVFARIVRIHASNVLAMTQQRLPRLTAPIQYALAKRGATRCSREQAAMLLRDMTEGAVSIATFDDDHESIVRSPSVNLLVAFLSNDRRHC